MDWAQEIATKFVGVYRETSLIDEKKWVDGIAAAIRQAKASGMRQAISIIRMQDGFKAPLVEAFEKAEAVAAEIEKGSQ